VGWRRNEGATAPSRHHTRPGLATTVGDASAAARRRLANNGAASSTQVGAWSLAFSQPGPRDTPCTDRTAGDGGRQKQMSIRSPESRPYALRKIIQKDKFSSGEWRATNQPAVLGQMREGLANLDSEQASSTSARCLYTSARSVSRGSRRRGPREHPRGSSSAECAIRRLSHRSLYSNLGPGAGLPFG